MHHRTTSKRCEFLPAGVVRPPRPQAVTGSSFDYPVTQAGTAGNVTVYYDPSLGTPGATLAKDLIARAAAPYAKMETDFGIAGGAVNVVVAPLSGKSDGSGGGYHYGCDFTTGGTIYVDATFADASAAATNLEVLLYIAELSECFMGAQGKGWGCGYSNGEALSRYLAQTQTPAGTLPQAFVTGPSWASAGYPDWISKTERTDQDYVSIGCGIVYIFWMQSLNYTAEQLAKAAGATLEDNYRTLTGKTTAYADLKTALAGRIITSDNPF